ncbi:MAG: RdgB/HAM1 family non-canonical purine NTP pyrophosphatase [Candidatus Marinimicrobia bacterium]|nr:RdgB/HAM1 family non-canonical purine NTP pyrophosphatase [Candidatus Neomarinimicrobiota bacterium]
MRLKTLDDFPGMPEVTEDGDTLKANAHKKAREIHAYTGLPAIADDTALEVEALDGAPGVFSSRYAGEDADYRDNMIKLLKDLNGIPPEQRRARFRTIIAFVNNAEAWDVEGVVNGYILDRPQGEGGFGYDPVFYYPPLEKTLSELDLNEKNRISHRGKAIEALLRKLQKKQDIEEETTGPHC